MYKKCKSYNLPVDISPILVEEDENGHKIHTIGFAKKMRLKHPIFLKYLLTTDYLLALDADIYFFKNPLILLKYINSSIDVVLACDGSKCDVLNYGLILFKKSKFTLDYLHKLIEIEKKCKSYEWSYSEQSLANKYMKEINYTHIQSININTFMDGYDFFNKINFLYNRSSNYLNLIGFHNDYTFGAVSKTYRIKELGLYELDDDGYYSSKSNKYVFYNKIINYNDSSSIILLSTLVYICNRTNRILIFPRFKCSEGSSCSFVRLFNLEYFEKKCRIKYRENSFLSSNRIPTGMLENSIEINKINSENDINKIKKTNNQLIILKETNNYYNNYNHCFRKDNYWQRKFKI